MKSQDGGNEVNPLDLINKFNTDKIRYLLSWDPASA